MHFLHSTALQQQCNSNAQKSGPKFDRSSLGYLYKLLILPQLQTWLYQSRRQIDKWGETYSCIRVLHYPFLFKFVVFPVSEHKCINMLLINLKTELLKRLLRYGIRTTMKPFRTLEQSFLSPKDRPPPEKQTNVIYKINCAECSWSYIGETGGALDMRKK